MTFGALADERIAELLNNRASSTVATWDYEMRCAMLETLAARDEQLALARGAYDNLEMKYQAERLSVAQQDEEIAGLKAKIDDFPCCGKCISAVLDARVAQLEAEIARLRPYCYCGSTHLPPVPPDHKHVTLIELFSRVAQLKAALRMWLVSYELPNESHEAIYGRIDAAAASRAALEAK